ncbi:MAG TPA: ATP-binding protein [Bryobacterales bacterium]|nr:ATP-binding protein [Bryobacterales bacterium]
MRQAPHQIELKVSSDPRWLRLVRAMMQEVSRQAGFGDAERCDITIAVDEALSNVIKHSYKGDYGRPVWLTCATEGDRLSIEIRDVGDAPDPKRLEPLPPEQVRPGGRGIFLMRSTMDEVQFERNGDTNLVRLSKYRKTRSPLQYSD